MIIQSDSVLLNARRALLARLHDGNLGTLENTLKDLSKFSIPDKTIVCLASDNDTDIGVCIIDKGGHLGVYVKPECRGRKIGEQLVRNTLQKAKRTEQTCYASPGPKEYESLQFWKRLGIFVDEEESTVLHGSTDGYPCYSINSLRDGLRFSLRAQGFSAKHFLWNFF
jgi:GNAT superfamily N-acetyltransferase